MKLLPFSDPGRPDTRSPTRFLLWIGRQQLPTLGYGVMFGIVWMLAQALLPYALGRAVDDGLAAGDNHALLLWAAVLLALGTVQAVAGVLRHRAAVSNWLQASFRMVQVVSHHVARSGPAVRANVTTGEVVATVSNDAMRAGGAFDITARLAGAIASTISARFGPSSAASSAASASRCAAVIDSFDRSATIASSPISTVKRR